ncbi:RNA 2'-phosphotransferase [Luteolibacter marinus]|uniref:RNA 2'-phosphotransferase n=1 Tax=Luteolibacter marinus TaxID=2776705 RepID=UPI001868E021|nr:RNA 2'-phosphotransferase [Luteolibacter marinus]
MELKRVSKLLSLVLRHDPGKIGILLDDQGWTDCGELIEAIRRRGMKVDSAILREVVLTNDKQRFAFNGDETRIRANQGHSVTVDLALVPQPPPECLFHGTVERYVESIRKDGLQKGSRHHVHLSPDLQTATKVGERRGKPVILKVLARDMCVAGHEFFVSNNGVWLTDEVPPSFIEFP